MRLLRSPARIALLTFAASSLLAPLAACGASDDGEPAAEDAGPLDASRPPPDSGPADTGPADTGPADTGPADTGPADTGPADTGPSTFALGGTATVAANTGTAGVGADGTGGLVLTNGVEDVTVLASGPFRFPTPIARGSAYAVTVKSAPTNPAQTCQVDAGTGTVAGAVDTIRVVCTAVPHKITGTLKGKRTPKLTLTSGTGVSVDVLANGAFEFPGTFGSGTDVAVAVSAAPGTQKCFVDGGTARVRDADIAVEVTCYDEVSFTGVNSPAVADFQVPLTLTTATFDYARAAATGADLRFFSDHKGAPIPYYFDRWNPAGDSKVWVRVPAIPAAGASKLLMFAGDAALPAASNGSATFEFFDDFEGNALDAAKWEVRGVPASTAVANGFLNFFGNSNWEYLRARTLFASGIFEADVRHYGVSAALVIGNAGTDNRFTFRDSNGSFATTVDPDISGGNAYFDTNYPGIARPADGVLHRQTVQARVDATNQIELVSFCSSNAACSGSKVLTGTASPQFFVGFSSYSPAYRIEVERTWVRKAAAGTFSAALL